MAHVLIVEDEATIRRFVRLALESAGHEIHEAEGVRRGLIEAGTRRPDLIVLDLGLPGKDGLDVLRGLRNIAQIGGREQLSHRQLGILCMTHATRRQQTRQ